MRARPLLIFRLALGALSIVGFSPLAQAKVYDLEHHFYVPEFYEYMTSRTTPPRFVPGDPKAANPMDRVGRIDIGLKTAIYMSDGQIAQLTDFTEARIAAMDAAGVDVAVMSSSSMIEAFPREKSIELARLSNDRLAAYQKRFPDRILGTATLPTVWVDDAREELERCVKTLGFKYWHTHDHYVTEAGETNYLWEAKFKPLLEKANELGVAIYIHPDYQPQARYDYGMGFMGAMLGFGQGVVQTATKFILKGRLDEYPNIRLVIGHTGEYLPYILPRMDNRFHIEGVPDPEVKCQKKFSEYFQEGRIFVTTSGNRSEPALQCAKRAIGIGHIAYGSDWPYETMDSMSEFIKTAKLTDEERRTVCEGTATERIFAKGKRRVKHFDFEHHFVSTNYINYVATRTESPMHNKSTGDYVCSGGRLCVNWYQKVYSPNTLYVDLTDLGEKRIAEMTKAGIDMAVLSSAFQVGELPPADAIRIAKASNDDLYQATLRHPDRFMGSALLPMLQVEEACRELERCVKTLGFKYWHVGSNVPDPDGKERHIWEPEFEPILAKAAELGVCIYVHPEYPLDKDYWDAGIRFAGPGMGFGQDVMQTAVHLVMNGMFDRYPKLRIILGHMGEYLPYVLDRLNFHMGIWSKAGLGMDVANVACEKSLYHYVVTNANFLVTTSGSADVNALRCAKEALGADRICFGSDWPYESYTEMASTINKCDLTDAERDGMWSLNAQKYILARKPDYAEPTGRDWLYNHAIAGKECPDEATEDPGVDLFYVYPTLVGHEQIVIDGFRGIDDATMRGAATNFMTAVGAFSGTARCFADMTHVYAPFYRQVTLAAAFDCSTNAAGEVLAGADVKYLKKLCEGPAYSDVTNALTTYFAKWNNNRPFILAAHSQGSAILRLVMENYFTLPENKDKVKNLVCSYQLGYGIGESSIRAIEAAAGVTFAERADDTKVIVSYNTMATGASGLSVLMPADALAINPLTWTRGGDLAQKDLNLGARASMMGESDLLVPNLYSAKVVYAKGRGQTVECAELSDKAMPPNLFGSGSLHAYDYAAYWENLRANARQRIKCSRRALP